MDSVKIIIKLITGEIIEYETSKKEIEKYDFITQLINNNEFIIFGLIGVKRELIEYYNIMPPKRESSKRVYVVSTNDYDYDEPREMTIVAESKEKAEGIAKANAYNPNSVWEAKEVDLNKEQILTIDILEG